MLLKKYFGVLHKPLLHIFNCSLQISIFPDKLKIARVTSLLKPVKTMNQATTDLYLCQYAVQKLWKKLCIFVFTSILLTIAYFTKSILGFMKDIPLNKDIQLVNQIRNSFESNHLGVFVDLLKAFDTVNQKTLKLGNYGIRGKILLWFLSYLTNGTQFNIIT